MSASPVAGKRYMSPLNPSIDKVRSALGELVSRVLVRRGACLPNGNRIIGRATLNTLFIKEIISPLGLEKHRNQTYL